LRQGLRLAPDRAIVLYVGVMDARKNILWLAEQWVENHAFGTDAMLLAVGPQSRDDRDRQVRDRLKELSSSAPHLFQLRDFTFEIVPYYQSADVLVLPSVKEGLPNVALEAMACGLPCVAALASGSRELVIDGRTGYTYAPGDSRGLGEAVRSCLGPEGRCLGEQARRLVETEYDIRHIADRYVALYEQLLGWRAPGSLAAV